MTARSFGLRRLLMLPAGLGLIFGLGAGLVRLGAGFSLPVPAPGLHGALMVGGFLGTLISLERAVALDRPAGYLVPAIAAAGAISLAAGAPYPAPQLLGLGASVGLAGLYFYGLRHRYDADLVVMAVGAILWAGGNLTWLLSRQLPAAVEWWAGFLVLTIVGERLELTRVVARPQLAGRLLALATALLVGGLVVGLLSPEPGRRISGLALAGMAGWLFKYDVAWVTVRRPGQARFIALCLIAGFFWLGVGGLGWVFGPYTTAGPVYDGVLHTIFLGFVMSMIFGHALVILPAVAGLTVPFHPAFYAHLLLLHLSLAVRILGDGAGLQGWRVVGGTLNVAAIVLFLLATAAAARLRTKRRPVPQT